MKMFRLALTCIALLLALGSAPIFSQEQETLAPLKDGKVPVNFVEMWAGFDPRKEPLEVETIKEWEEHGTVLRIVRFRIGVFKNKKAMLAGIYGFPKKAVDSGKKVPGLLQIHGGGQYADHRACVANAKLGYATISIAWAGRISAPGYRVDPNGVKLFWDDKTEDPKFKLTTDWGALDGYHAPSRNPGNIFPSVKPADWTLDNIESPRNSPWFICALAARRALTFLESQPEVDGNRLGVYGHSMGGKLTVMTSTDRRVKAAAPSCGGISDRQNASELFRNTIGDDVSLKEISCPIVFLSPANDFHGRIGDLPTATSEISSKQWRVTCSAHLNHKDRPENEVTTLLWFEQHLKGAFAFPDTPATKLDLETSDGIPEFRIGVDPKFPYAAVDVYYTQQGLSTETNADRENTINRFWHHGEVEKSPSGLTAKLPDLNPAKPLWIYANVTYPLEQPVSGVGYYYGAYTATEFNLSSVLIKVLSEQLKSARTTSRPKTRKKIEDFKGNWKKEWFTTEPGDWRLSTHKVYDDMFVAPKGAELAIEVYSSAANTLLIQIDDHVAEVQLLGKKRWQLVQLKPNDFKNFDGQTFSNWDGIKTLKLCDAIRLKDKQSGQRRVVGKRWVGEAPQFRNLQWAVD